MSAGSPARMRDAFDRAGVAPADVDLVVAHGTGTALNDPTEAAALRELLRDRRPGGPWSPAIKGAVGHTSGGAALLSLAVAVRALRDRVVPPGRGSAPARCRRRRADVRVEASRVDARASAQVNAFGFGGVNAVTLVERIVAGAVVTAACRPRWR